MRRDYGPDVLAEGAGRRRRAEFPQVPAERGLVVEEAGGGFCGAVVDCEKQAVTLEDRAGRQRVLAGPGPSAASADYDHSRTKQRSQTDSRSARTQACGKRAISAAMASASRLS